MGSQEFGLQLSAMERISKEISAVHKMGVEVCLVIGGGNIFRGLSGVAVGLDRASADHMGMLATVINALGVQSVLEGLGIETRVLSAIPMATVCEPYIRRRAVRHMEKGRVVIFAAGTGNPFFTTDTAAALRAAEIQADVVLKATHVDGVYSADPNKDKNATRYDELTFTQAQQRDLRFMDQTAIALCRENDLPIMVFDMRVPGNILKVVCGEKIGTVVRETRAP